MGKDLDLSDRRKAYLGITLLGIVSLLGDIVYEGSRGIVPDYLKFLGATALVVGLMGGLGDFLGYTLRLLSGFLVDVTNAYWLFIFVGYGLIASIPLLGISTGIEVAILLVLVERVGKGLRAPSRDTVVSVVAKDIGTGRGFGIHEFLDQIGAIAGPALVVAIMFYSANRYSVTFALLGVPFLALLLFLVYTYRKIGPQTTVVDLKKTEKRTFRFSRPFYTYILAVALNAIGLVPYTLILFKAAAILDPVQQQWGVPLFYVLIQGVDAPAALLSGFAFDRFGLKMLILPFVLSVFPPLLIMVGSDLVVLAAASAIFGFILGTQESIYRAAVSELTPLSSRGTAYGIFNTVYGLGLLISGAVYGFIIDYKIPLTFTAFFTLLMQIPATALLLSVGSEKADKQGSKQ